MRHQSSDNQPSSEAPTPRHFIIEFPAEWYLRGTVATGDINRATRYASEEEAKAALAKAAKFMGRAAVKAARIVEVAQ